MNKKHVIGYTPTALVALGVGGAAAGGGSTPPAAPVTTTVTSAATITAAPVTVTAQPAAQPAPATTPSGSEIPGDGTYQVGIDIQPGTYVSEKPSSGMCYWARLKSQDTVGGIIANNLSEGRSVVTIAAGDKLFETRGCSAWTKR